MIGLALLVRWDWKLSVGYVVRGLTYGGPWRLQFAHLGLLDRTTYSQSKLPIRLGGQKTRLGREMRDLAETSVNLDGGISPGFPHTRMRQSRPGFCISGRRGSGMRKFAQTFLYLD